MKEIIPVNKYQTPITEELLSQYPDEIQDSKCYTVYRHISPCGKVYVGITKLALSDRWGRCGCRYKRCKLFYRAILKYGWDNFRHDIILENISKSEAIYTEKYLIMWYKTHGISYNITDGGESTRGIHMPKEAKERISKRLKVIRSKPVLQYSINGDFIMEYPSAKEAARVLGYSRHSVSACASCSNGKTQLYGFIFIYKDDISSLGRRVELCKNHWRKYGIVQYLNGVPINTFESISEAERITGVNGVCIRRNISGKYKVAGGYTWTKFAK